MRTERFEFFTDDYATRLNELRIRAIAAERADDDSGTARVGDDNAELDAINAEYQALKAEAVEKARKGELRPLGRSEWREIKAKHPPRLDHPDEETVKQDRAAGVNSESVEDDLVYAALVEPEFKTRKAFEDWADTFSAGEWQALVTRAWFLTVGAGPDPKSLPDSLTPNSVATSS